jgi:hypothetical protein
MLDVMISVVAIIVSIPKANIIKKNKIAHIVAHGNFNTTFGNATNANPDPLSTTSEIGNPVSLAMKPKMQKTANPA